MLQGLIAMKPRQVLLSSSSKNPSNGRPLSLTPEQRPLLLQAVCHFLESNGFSKTLKKFLSEASIEKDSWKNCSLNLEDACCMYLDVRSQNNADGNGIKSDKRSEEILGNDANLNSKEKKKKKSTEDLPTQNTEIHSKESEAALEDTSCQEKSSKKAKDKKKKKVSEPAPESLNEDLQSAEEGSKGKTDPEKSSKSKSERRKKKDSKMVSSSPVDDTEQNGMRAIDGQEENKKSTITSSEDGIEQEKKSSKKRKKSSCEDNKCDGHGAASEDSKRRKTDEQVTKDTAVPAALDKQLENGKVDSQTPSSTIRKHSETLSGENGGDKSALKKSSAKKENGSAEPRALNAFQRVKADEVEFADEKLQDNSYWAKNGAESGYGAKAQEVLGQVRGRDFRHEKTKKKRGSYRGGQIDFQSHSVKFNYSDDDE